MTLKFTKMHGLGNDFMVMDAINQHVKLSSLEITTLANRATGVGFDQCLLIEKSPKEGIDFFYRIYNADGNEVGQCGNGARCLARFVHYYGLTKKTVITVATPTTHMQLHLNADESVTVDMGKPKFDPKHIPLNMPQLAPLYRVPLLNNEQCEVHAVNVGNPHAVLMVNDLTTIAVQELGQQISEHSLFPEQTNAGFMQILSPNYIQLRVYERGCGETRACGSGAVAAVAVGRKYHQLAEQVKVSLPGGELLVEWPNINDSIFLTGPAMFVYEGKLFS